VPILSVIVAYHFHHGSARAADVIHTAFADNMAHGLPIHWSPFFVVGVIGLARPTDVEDGLRWDSLLLYFGALLLVFSSFEIHLGDSFLG
jgi:hypothetical protein